MMTRKPYYYILILAILFTATSCFLERKEKNMIDLAEVLIDERPDSVLSLLDSVMFPENLGEEYYHKHRLLRVQARDKCNKDITQDSSIARSKAYFIQVNNLGYAARSAFYEGKILEELKMQNDAMQAYSEAAYLAEKTTDTYLNGQIYTGIGLLYQRQYLIEQAIENFKIAEGYFQQLNDAQNIIGAYKNIANSFLFKSEIDSSFFYYNQALNLAIQEKETELEAHLYQNIGVAHLYNGEYKTARNFLRRSALLHKDDEEIAKVFLSTAIAFGKEARRDSALYYVDRVSAYDKEKKDAALQANISNTLAKIEESSKNFEKALSHKNHYVNYSEKKLKEKNEQSMLEVRERYNYEQTRIDNSRLTISKQKSTIVILALISAVVILTTVLIWRHNKHKEEKLLAERQIFHLKDLANSYNEEKKSMRDIVLDHFNIFKKTALMEKYMREDDKKRGEKLLAKFNETVYGQDSFDWQKTYESLNHIYNGFCNKLKIVHPELDETEFRICCLTYAKLSNLDISIIMNYKLNSIQTKKYSIRKKLKIEGYKSIRKYLDKKLFNRESDEEPDQEED